MRADDPRLNPYGGAIAFGHPLAATGVRLIAQLAYGLRERGATLRGLTALCIGLAPGCARSSGTTLSERHGLKLNRVGSIALRHRSPTTARITASRRRSAAPPSSRRSPCSMSSRAATGARPSSPANRSSSASAPTSTSSRRWARPRTRREGTRAGHALFGRIRALPFPTVAAINGAALGGRTRARTALHARTLASNVRLVSFPEVALSIIPAWGGTQLLPKLIGPEAAAKVICSIRCARTSC